MEHTHTLLVSSTTRIPIHDDRQGSDEDDNVMKEVMFAKQIEKFILHIKFSLFIGTSYT